MYSSGDETYCYPDSTTLKNQHGATDAEELAELESLLYYVRHAELIRNPPPFALAFQHLKYIHRHLFQDTYSWAGDTRTVDMSKGTTRFAVWEQIELQAQQLFTTTALEYARLKASMRNPKGVFPDVASEFLIELNMIHPFREGNGRVMRSFMELWATDAGMALDWELIPHEQFLRAVIHGVLQDASLMRTAIRTCLH